jgi:poly(3-hydroxybutyrate) depolymerase
MLLYHAYQAMTDVAMPARMWARVMRAGLDVPLPRGPVADAVRRAAAACEVFGRLELTHARPGYGIDAVDTASGRVPVVEVPTLRTPFGTLLHFEKPPLDPPQPKVLLVAPMSGHFATLLRHTVRTLLADHDVWITDWHNARDVPLAEGAFGLDDYVTHLVRFLEAIGPRANLVAVCQPTVPALAAVALMSEDGHPATPRTMTLMAGPIDVRVSPTEVNRLACERPIEWFERTLISTVPLRHPGRWRRVYPGFVQLAAFMGMNPARHRKAFDDLYRHAAAGDRKAADGIGTFYEEYFAMADLPAEFYLQTVERIFQRAELARGTFSVHGRRVDCTAIRRTALMTVEGEKDDICSVGQTVVAQELCASLRPSMRRHLVQTGVGHYGVFAGRRWEHAIHPALREFVHAFS